MVGTFPWFDPRCAHVHRVGPGRRGCLNAACTTSSSRARVSRKASSPYPTPVSMFIGSGPVDRPPLFELSVASVDAWRRPLSLGWDELRKSVDLCTCQRSKPRPRSDYEVKTLLEGDIAAVRRTTHDNRPPPRRVRPARRLEGRADDKSESAVRLARTRGHVGRKCAGLPTPSGCVVEAGSRGSSTAAARAHALRLARTRTRA